MSTPQATLDTRQTAGSSEPAEKPNLLNLPAEIRLQIYTELLRMANMKTRFRIESRYDAMISGPPSHRIPGATCPCGGPGPARWLSGACELCRDQYLQLYRPWFVNAEDVEGLGPWKMTQHIIPSTYLANHTRHIDQSKRPIVFMQEDPSSHTMVQTCKKLYHELYDHYLEAKGSSGEKICRDVVYLLGPRDHWRDIKNLIQHQSSAFRVQIRHLTFQGDHVLQAMGQIEPCFLAHEPLEPRNQAVFHEFEFPNLLTLTVDVREPVYMWYGWLASDQQFDIHNLWQFFFNGRSFFDRRLAFLKTLRDHKLPSVKLFYRFSIQEEHPRRHRHAGGPGPERWTKVKTFKYRLDDAQNPLEEEVSYHPRHQYAED